MAFGDLKGGVTAISVAANSITNPTDAVGSVAVVVGDLVFVVVGEQTTLTAGTVTDNLGNSYTATNSGTDAGTSTGRAYYSRVTVAGTLTTIHVAATGSTDNVAIVAGVFTGPFAFLPLDANPSNITTQTTSPFTAPATGTLSQNSELVVSWAVATGSTVWSATSPNTLGAQLATQAVLHSVIGYQTVSATTTVAPAFTAGSNPTDSVLGTSSFRQDPGAIGDTSYLQYPSAARHIPRTHLRDFSVQQTFQDDTSEARNPFRLGRTFAKTDRLKHDASQSSIIDPGGVPSTQTLTPSFFTNTNTFYVPTVSLQELPAGSVPAPRRRKLPVPRHKDESLSGSIAFDQTLTSSFYTNTNTFYVPVVNLQVIPLLTPTLLPPSLRRKPRTYLRDFSISPFLPLLDETALIRAPFILRRSFNKPKYKHDNTQGTPLDTGVTTQTLTPSLYANTNTFYTPVVSLQELPAAAFPAPRRRILPVPRHKSESIAGSVSFDQSLTPSLYTNTNIFYVSVVNLQELPVGSVPSPRRRELPIPRYKNESIAGSISFDQTLTPSFYTNTSIFYVPVVSLQEIPTPNFPPVRRRILPIPRHKDESASGSISSDQTLTPSLYTNVNIFYSPTITAGIITLTPSLYTNVNTFYTPIVTLQEFPSFNILLVKRQIPTKVHRDHSVRATYIFAQTLTPDLYTNDNTFYAPTIAKEGVNLFPDTYINTNIFYTPTITTGNVNLNPSPYTNTNIFYAPVVTLQELPAAALPPIRKRVVPNRHRDHNVAGSTSFDQTLIPSLYTNSNTFYSSIVNAGSSTLDPPLYINNDTFYSSTVALQEFPSFNAPTIRSGRLPRHRDPSVRSSLIAEAVTLFPSLYSDADTFYTSIISSTYVLSAQTYINTNTFYAHSLTGGIVTLLPNLYTNTNKFYEPVLSIIVPPPPTIVGGVVGQGYRPPKITNATTNGILFTVPITIIPGGASTISLLPGKARIDVVPEIRPFMNSVEADFTVIGTAKGTDILEDNMDDLMLILSQILLD